MKQYTAHQIAEWLVAWAEETEEAELTPLKIQKLLYYAKGLYMRASGGVPLFNERMEAWAHGPVVVDIYRELKEYGKSPIDPDTFISDDFNWDDYRPVEDTLIDYGISMAPIRRGLYVIKPTRSHLGRKTSLKKNGGLRFLMPTSKNTSTRYGKEE
ncbi:MULTISPECIES: Panacea domain-containing protein [Corynebacterium]|jgi:XRE family transcriptional regulator|uniref:Panacea domain-containing protein n=1 Tax=Corynebacterium TaxID=1716 RepID=UPI0003B871AD|nr:MULTISPECIES: type II toxin-antitoxin system antitoxin SocA domain-containing protein [Corynebacterium]ERS42504.1 hypothetical protein HMPREF1293_01096 [Corynebacterium sp. KPL1996]ERS45836.1 hypothetical protein HMPREF1287_00272 [Corynebacterium sp. KPL1986]ERS70229.1 hypothetical protein HMPREF1300_01904 [Corynebacterium sp. KPL2004]ERS70602.1 hypothetical protein HMPREF1295_01823 [Corynebacterium sp. KPL1998]MCT1409139.1 DUF4065 domain-containing protein [Corynebacterium accolens]